MPPRLAAALGLYEEGAPHATASAASATSSSFVPFASGRRPIRTTTLAAADAALIPTAPQASFRASGGHSGADFLESASASSAAVAPQLPGRATRSSFSDDIEEAGAQASLSEAEIRKVVQQAHSSAQAALTAAQVAIWCEVIGVVGTMGGILGSWIALKMDDSELPAEYGVPEKTGVDFPSELLRPPPGYRSEAGSRNESAPDSARNF